MLHFANKDSEVALASRHRFCLGLQIPWVSKVGGQCDILAFSLYSDSILHNLRLLLLRVGKRQQAGSEQERLVILLVFKDIYLCFL